MHDQFQAAVDLVDSGDVAALRNLLDAHPDLATARDEGNAPLLIRLIDWPGHRPNAADTARVLLEAGAEVDARRDDENGTALGGALCTGEADVIKVLLDFGADIHAPCGWQPAPETLATPRRPPAPWPASAPPRWAPTTRASARSG